MIRVFLGFALVVCLACAGTPSPAPAPTSPAPTSAAPAPPAVAAKAPSAADCKAFCAKITQCGAADLAVCRPKCETEFTTSDDRTFVACILQADSCGDQKRCMGD